ncbi:MAG: heme-copper oxidase subunit III [Acidimicrobiales bacterium]|nr:cytochrome c oxidase subunit 3 [Actinomycetota bacterium]
MEVARRPPLLAVGTIVWLASELMFFSGLFAAYFTLRATARGPWPPEGVELEATVAGVFTLILLASSGTIQLAVRAITAGDRRRFCRWLLVTMALAIVFLVNQGREWSAAEFAIDSHSFGSAFFVMTGFHGLHVAGGVAAMAVLLGRAATPGPERPSERSGRSKFGADDAPAVEVVSFYWHFVDVVWVGLYATLFLLR